MSDVLSKKGQRHSREPIKTRGKYNQVADAKRGKMRAGESQLISVLLLIG